MSRPVGLLSNLAAVILWMAAPEAWAAPLDILIGFGGADGQSWAQDPVLAHERAVTEVALADAGLEWRMRPFTPTRILDEIARNESVCGTAITAISAAEHGLPWIALVETRFVLLARPGLEVAINRLEDLRAYRVGAFVGGRASLYLVEAGLKPDLAPRDALNLAKLNEGRIDFWYTTVGSLHVATAAGDATLPRVVLYGPTMGLGIACNPAMDEAVMAKLRTAAARFRAAHGNDWIDLR